MGVDRAALSAAEAAALLFPSCKPIGNRLALTGILCVLTSGILWELP